ncbi:MAG: hypothetical protein AMXMBFR64_23600 [Myxococcales bacterium]
MEIHPDFRDLLTAFARHGVRYLLVGGYAVSFHSKPRFTKDMDIWVGPGEENFARLAAALCAFGAPVSVLSSMEEWSDDEILYMGSPPVRIDLLKTIPGVSFEEALPHAVTADWEGAPVSVIGLDDLIRNKEATARRQDLRDAAALRRQRR